MYNFQKQSSVGFRCHKCGITYSSHDELVRYEKDERMNDITKQLRDLADELDEKSAAPARPWPPKGVAIEIHDNFWLPRTSLGDGRYKHPISGNSITLEGWKWRYAPAPWDIAPESAGSWVVTDVGETFWSVFLSEKVGDGMDNGTIVHVEYRGGSDAQ